MVEQIFLSPQEKGSVIISIKLVYMSCLTSYHDTTEILEKLGNIRKMSKLHRIMA